jgi:hypothetical protein
MHDRYAALLALCEYWKVKDLLSEPANLNRNIGDIASFANLYAASVAFSLQLNINLSEEQR